LSGSSTRGATCWTRSGWPGTFSTDRLLPIDLAIRDWARHDQAVADRARRVDNRRMQLLRDAISTFCPDPDEVEARSLLAFCMAIGSTSSPPTTPAAAAPRSAPAPAHSSSTARRATPPSERRRRPAALPLLANPDPT
jgi:hypothetical protein